MLISSCSTVTTTGDLFTPVSMESSESSVIYIYRPSREFNSAGWVELFVNNEKRFGLVDNSYSYIIINEGEYTIKAEGSMFGTNWWPGPAEISISIAAGKEYYMRVTPMPPGKTTDIPGPLKSGLSAAVTAFSDNSKAQTEIKIIKKDQALNEIAKAVLVEQ